VKERQLRLEDIAEARAYERERDSFRSAVIELKRKRRVAVGPVVTLVFENRETVRFQIQEMVRAERLYSDEAIQAELETYNPLIPDPGELSASLFIELTNRTEMEHWLPRLVGIETAVRLEIHPPTDTDSRPVVIPCVVDEEHAANLTREQMTAAVHFVRFELTPPQVDAFRTGRVAVAIDHPEYQERTEIGESTRDSLTEDLLG
jgi:hypothetical protein